MIDSDASLDVYHHAPALHPNPVVGVCKSLPGCSCILPPGASMWRALTPPFALIFALPNCGGRICITPACFGSSSSAMLSGSAVWQC